VTVMNAHTAATSLLLPLGEASTGGGHIALYAQNPGALTNLAADARIVRGRGGDTVIGGHLPPPTPFAAQRSVDALADRSSINQALGFLIGQGYPPAQAEAELGCRATATGASLAQVAVQVLNTVGLDGGVQVRDHAVDPGDDVVAGDAGRRDDGDEIDVAVDEAGFGLIGHRDTRLDEAGCVFSAFVQ